MMGRSRDGSQRATLTEKLKLLGLSANETHDFPRVLVAADEPRAFTAVRFCAARGGSTPRRPSTSRLGAEDGHVRVLVDFRTLDKPQKLPEQTLTTAPAREG